jgi:hypothetical protein
MATTGATKASDGPRKEPNAMPTMRLEHQESINRFSRLNTEKKMLEARKKALERALEDAEEAGNEVMLADEDAGTLPSGWTRCLEVGGHDGPSCRLRCLSSHVLFDGRTTLQCRTPWATASSE